MDISLCCCIHICPAVAETPGTRPKRTTPGHTSGGRLESRIVEGFWPLDLASHGDRPDVFHVFGFRGFAGLGEQHGSAIGLPCLAVQFPAHFVRVKPAARKTPDLSPYPLPSTLSPAPHLAPTLRTPHPILVQPIARPPHAAPHPPRRGNPPSGRAFRVGNRRRRGEYGASLRGCPQRRY